MKTRKKGRTNKNGLKCIFPSLSLTNSDHRRTTKMLEKSKTSYYYYHQLSRACVQAWEKRCSKNTLDFNNTLSSVCLSVRPSDILRGEHGVRTYVYPSKDVIVIDALCHSHYLPTILLMYVRLSIIFSSSSIEFLTHIFVADPRPIEERGDETDTTGAEQSSTKHAS